ncbi:MAG: TauD/TfdA family dioxygenase [Snowella sp.]|nr:TauD/TfdA family dioxygenase [Snowella sp.]
MVNINLQDVTFKLTDLTNLSSYLKTKIFQTFNTVGFFIIEGNDPYQSHEIFLSLPRYFGKVLNHEQANEHGVIPIWVMPNYPEYVNTKNNDLGLHTDGSFEKVPPKIMALYCEVAAQQGGETQLVDGKSVYEYLAQTDPEALMTLFEPDVFSIKRANRSATRSIFTEDQGRIYMTFRADDDANFSVKPEASKAFTLIKNFVADPTQQIIFKLQPNQILVLDNRRILHGRKGFSIHEKRKLHGLWFDGHSTDSPELMMGFVPVCQSLQVNLVTP